MAADLYMAIERVEAACIVVDEAADEVAAMARAIGDGHGQVVGITATSTSTIVSRYMLIVSDLLYSALEDMRETSA